MRTALAAISFLMTRSAFGQIAFEVASIKPAPPQPMGQVSIHRSTDKGRLSFSNVSLLDLVADASHLPHRQIMGPDWLDSTRFDVVAKIPEGADKKQVPEMLRALLVERFGLKIHDETKEGAVYVLTVGKGAVKLKKIESGGGISSNTNKVRTHMSAKTTMADFADSLSQRMDRPVLDQTGLEGSYEFELEWTPESVLAAGGDAVPEAPSIFTAIQEQLGLKLNATKAPVRLVVVDHIEKTPAAN